MSRSIVAKPFTTVFFLAAICIGSLRGSEGKIGEVFWVQRKGEITELVLKTSVELVPGLVVQIGKKEFAVVGPKTRQDNSGFYFQASIPEPAFVKAGEPVFWVPIGEFKAPPGRSVPEVLIEIRKTIPFAPKRIGKITATQPPKVLVDKGSLHDVLRGDVFAVYDSTGRYKGQIEVRMVGDLQAVAYQQGDIQPKEGDQIVFLGQKKRFAMGFVFAGPRIPGHPLNAQPIGGGMLLDLTFSRGWVLEFNFGAYHPGFGDEREEDPNNPSGAPLRLTSRRVYFLMPVTIRKHLFWPRTVSPYLGVGFATFFRQLTAIGGEVKEIEILPMPHLQAGIELFSGRFFRPRIEARYFFGPKVDGLSTNSLFIGIGFTAGVGG